LPPPGSLSPDPQPAYRRLKEQNTLSPTRSDVLHRNLLARRTDRARGPGRLLHAVRHRASSPDYEDSGCLVLSQVITGGNHGRTEGGCGQVACQEPRQACFSRSSPCRIASRRAAVLAVSGVESPLHGDWPLTNDSLTERPRRLIPH
jgi:hypothetical protein